MQFNKKFMHKEYEKWELEYDPVTKIMTNKVNGKKLSTIGQLNTWKSSYYCIYKNKTSEILNKNNIPTANQYLWNNSISDVNNLLNLKKYKMKYPLVVKPNDGQQGIDVYLDQTNKIELLDKINIIRKKNKNPIIESQINGNNFRILIFNNEIVDVVMRASPTVKGDGKKKLKDLIDDYNMEQKMNNDYIVSKLSIDLINNQGYTLESTIPNDKVIYITNIFSYHNGSRTIRINEKDIHEKNKLMFLKVNKALGLTLSGIDYMSSSLKIPYTEEGAVIEVNSAPGIVQHYRADKNDKNYAVTRFVRGLYKMLS